MGIHLCDLTVQGIWKAHLNGELAEANVADQVAVRAAGVLEEKGRWTWMFGPESLQTRDPGDPYGLDGPIGEAFEGIEGVACEDLPRRPNSGGPADEQYSPKTPQADVSNPNDVVPNTTVKMMLNTGGPPNFAVGALCSWERPRWRDAVS